MREQLYLPIEKFSLFYRYFLFFDTKPYLACPLFVRHKVAVRFNAEYRHNAFPYIAVFCRVRRKCVGRFFLAMEDLKKSMLITGHRTYEKEVSGFLDIMEEKRRSGR